MACSMPASSVLFYFLCLFNLLYTEWVMLSNCIVSFAPLLLLPTFPSIRFQQQGFFFNELTLHIRWPEGWSFSFSISTYNEYLCLFPLGMTSLISLQSKGLQNLLHNTIEKHQCFTPQILNGPSLLNLYMTPGKIIALTILTFVCKVMSLLFNMLSGFVIAVLTKSRCLLIS